MAAGNFGYMIRIVNPHCVSILEQIMDFLIEGIQGPCLDNQIEVSKCKTISICKDFQKQFQKHIDYQKFGFIEEEQQQQIDGLVKKVRPSIVCGIVCSSNICTAAASATTPTSASI